MDHVDSNPAYEEAVRLLVGGAMPVIVEVEDCIHVLGVIPASRGALAAMIDEDPQRRFMLIVNTVREVKAAIEAGRVS